jgi:hypothetical protein
MRWLVGTVLVLLVSFVIYVGSAVWSVKVYPSVNGRLVD